MKPDDDECGLTGPDDRYLLFLKVPEPKSVKNRMHICLRPDRPESRRGDRPDPRARGHAGRRPAAG